MWIDILQQKRLMKHWIRKLIICLRILQLRKHLNLWKSTLFCSTRLRFRCVVRAGRKIYAYNFLNCYEYLQEKSNTYFIFKESKMIGDKSLLAESMNLSLFITVIDIFIITLDAINISFYKIPSVTSCR